MPGQLSMNDTPPDSQGPGANIFALGQAALDSGAVHPDEVKALLPMANTPEGMEALHNALGKPRGNALIPPSLRAASAAQNPALPDASGLATGKGKQTKQTSKSDESEKLNQTRNVWSTPDEINSRLDAISQSAPVQEQRQGIADQERLLSMQEKNADKDGWIKPLLALGDAQSGGGVNPGHMAASFTAPEVAQAKVANAADNLQKRKEALNKLIFDAAGKAKEGTDNSQLQNSLQQMLGYTQGMVSGNGLSEVRANQLRANSGAAFDKDSVLKAITNTNNSLDRATSIMDGKTPVTAKNFALLQQDMINAMAPGGAASEGKVNREMVSTLSTALNDLAQKGGSIQDLRKDDPALFKQLRGLITQVQQDYAIAGLDRGKELHSTWESVDDPRVQDTIDRKLKYWQDRADKVVPKDTVSHVKKTDAEIANMNDADYQAYKKTIQ